MQYHIWKGKRTVPITEDEYACWRDGWDYGLIVGWLAACVWWPIVIFIIYVAVL